MPRTVPANVRILALAGLVALVAACEGPTQEEFVVLDSQPGPVAQMRTDLLR